MIYEIKGSLDVSLSPSAPQGPRPGKMYELPVFSVHPQVSYQLEVQRETSTKTCMLTSNREKMTDKGLKLTMKGLCLRRSSKFVHKRKRF